MECLWCGDLSDNLVCQLCQEDMDGCTRMVSLGQLWELNDVAKAKGYAHQLPSTFFEGRSKGEKFLIVGDPIEGDVLTAGVFQGHSVDDVDLSVQSDYFEQLAYA